MAYYHLDLARSAAQTELARSLAALRAEFDLPTAFAKVQTYSLGRGTYYDRPTISLDDYGNPDLKPEFTAQYEFGFKSELTRVLGLVRSSNRIW